MNVRCNLKFHSASNISMSKLVGDKTTHRDSDGPFVSGPADWQIWSARVNIAIKLFPNPFNEV